MSSPNAIRILSQDFPDDVRTWINRLITPMNQFMTDVSALLHKGLNFKDHLNSEIKTIRLTASDQPTIACQLRSRPIGVVVIRSEEELKSAVFVDWVTAENGIKIRHIFGLEPEKTYALTLLIIGN